MRAIAPPAAERRPHRAVSTGFDRGPAAADFGGEDSASCAPRRGPALPLSASTGGRAVTACCSREGGERLCSI